MRRVLPALGVTFLALLAPAPIRADAPPAMAPGSTPDGYPPTTHYQTPCTNKCTAGREGNTISHVVLLSSESGKDAAIATEQNDSGKSIHYLVANDGSVGDFVPEADTAWYACDWPYNLTSIGVMVEGYVSTPSSFGELDYERAAQLVAAISHRYQFPIDADHVLTRGSIQNTACTGSGPDPSFDMTRLRTLAQQYRDELDPPPPSPTTTDTTPATSTPPPDTTPPAVTLSGPVTQKVGPTVTVALTCPSEGCTIVGSGVVRLPRLGRNRARAYDLARVATTVAQGGTDRVRFRLSPALRAAIRRALRAHRRIIATLTFTVSDAGGNRTTITRRVKFRR